MYILVGTLTSVITGNTLQSMQRLIQPLDSWRASLPARMNISDSSLEHEIYLLEALTTSYRFECIMCRLLHRGRWRVHEDSVRQWAQQRFRAATLELDSILKRVLISGTIRKMPTTLYVYLVSFQQLTKYWTLIPSQHHHYHSSPGATYRICSRLLSIGPGSINVSNIYSVYHACHRSDSRSSSY